VKYLQQNEWMNDEIRESIRKRDFYHKKKDMCNYWLRRKNVKYLVETSKLKYYTNIIANMKGKSNKLWKHLHNVSGCENHGTAMTLNDCDGEHIRNPKYIVDIFNNHFVNITENMDLNPNTDITYTEQLDNYISGRIPENPTNIKPICTSTISDSRYIKSNRSRQYKC
jgi:hypothetical protein